MYRTGELINLAGPIISLWALSHKPGAPVRSGPGKQAIHLVISLVFSSRKKTLSLAPPLTQARASSLILLSLTFFVRRTMSQPDRASSLSSGLLARRVESNPERGASRVHYTARLSDRISPFVFAPYRLAHVLHSYTP